MYDTKFWRDLEGRFRAVPDPDRTMYAAWHSKGGSHWRIGGGLDERARNEFKAVAKMAALALDHPPGPGAWCGWLETLKLKTTDPEDVQRAEGTPEGPGVPKAGGVRKARTRSAPIVTPYEMVTIRGVCDASARYCIILQAEALEAEEGLRTGDAARSQGAPMNASPDPALEGARRRAKFPLNVDRINSWMKEEGYDNEELGEKLQVNPRVVSSMRNNGIHHGRRAVEKLAQVMKCDPADLYLEKKTTREVRA